MHYQNLAAITPEKARLIQNGITREEYRRRFGMDDAAFAYFSQLESEKGLVERMAKRPPKPLTAKGRILKLLDLDVCLPARTISDLIGVSHSSAADDLRDLRDDGKVVSIKKDGHVTLWRRA
jgi:hypothetical protein